MIAPDDPNREGKLALIRKEIEGGRSQSAYWAGFDIFRPGEPGEADRKAFLERWEVLRTLFRSWNRNQQTTGRVVHDRYLDGRLAVVPWKAPGVQELRSIGAQIDWEYNQAVAERRRLRAATGLTGGVPAAPDKVPQDGPTVILKGPGKQPTVLGKSKPQLRKAQYEVVKAAHDAHAAGGLTKDGLVEMSKHADAVNILKRLARSDRDWKEVIHLAGRPGGRYWVG
jgi:hypothetical protein